MGTKLRIFLGDESREHSRQVSHDDKGNIVVAGDVMDEPFETILQNRQFRRPYWESLDVHGHA